MAVCLGIEVAPTAYRIVEVDSSLRPERGAVETRVVSFTSVPRVGAEAQAALAALRGRQANVVLWTRTDYRQVAVKDASSARMLAEARQAARAASSPGARRTAQIVLGRVDLQTERTLADITPTGAVRPDGRREVLLASATADEVASQLRPLLNAGLRVGAVLTAAGALHALALARRSMTAPGALEAYVALEESTTCMALVQDGRLLAAGDLPWGFMDAPELENHVERVAWELSGFAATWCPSDRSIDQICLCGGPPELRTLAMALMQVLDVEVEPLDSMFAIDAGHLPAPAANFREQIAQLRLAWAAASGESPAIDLFRRRRASARAGTLPYAVTAAGAAAGLLLGWQAQARWPPVESARVRLASAPAPRPSVSLPVTARVSAGAERPLPPLPSLEVEKAPEAADAASVPPPVLAPSTEPVAVAAQTRPVEDVAVQTAPIAATASLADRPPPQPTVRRPAEEVVLPFDADLQTILWSPDRALAIVDGRIVQPGDDVRGARVQRITETAVMLRDARGRARRLSLSGVRE